MDSMASRRNDSPFKTSNSYAILRSADNLPHRQSSPSASSSFRPGFSPQRAAYNPRQSLSRSYDSPEGLRRMSHLSSKKASSSLRRAASPPARQHISASGRNQTILDDAAWMYERIHNFQKTGFLRYPSISKLRDTGEISRSLDLSSASNKDDEQISILSYSSPGCFKQSSTIRHCQSATNEIDEPLSAFRLSEVTLSEEDLLTDISSSREFSTCNSTPVSVQSSRNFDQLAPEFYRGSPLAHNVVKDNHKYMLQSNARPDCNINYPRSSESTPNMHGDLLLRLEALQYRAGLTKGGNDVVSSNSDTNQGNWNSKLFRSGQTSHWDQDTLPSNQKLSACTQQSNAASAASPTHSYASVESISWPEEPENSFDSTCWLKAVNEEGKTESSASHLILSSNRSIRPEYYLPLSREEDPIFEAGTSPFSSSKVEKRTELRNVNIRGLPLGMCQQRYEQIRPRKSVNNHKQTSLAQKSMRFVESPTNSKHKSGSMKARGMAAFSSPKLSPGVAGRALPTEARPSPNHLCIEYKDIAHPVHDPRKNTDKSFEMKALASEKDGQTRDSLENSFECDGESSWISEENVEGFLCSQSFALSGVEGLNTSNEWSSPVLDTNLITCISKTSTSFCSEKPLRNKSIEDFQMMDSNEGIFPSNKFIADICMVDRCDKLPSPFQGGSAITSQTDACLQLSNEGSLADSHQAVNIYHQSVCQIIHSGDEQLNNDVVACGTDTLINEQSLMESRHDAGIKKQISQQVCSSSWSSVSAKDLERVFEESVENMALQAEKKLENTDVGQCHSARYSFQSSIPSVSENSPLSLDALSSPADLVEDWYWPVTASRNESTTQINKMHSQNLLEGRSSEHKGFARIVRSLSFSEQGNSDRKQSSNFHTSRDISESKSTGFTHYWIPNRAYSLNSFDPDYNGGTYSGNTQEEQLNIKNSVEMQQNPAQITKELMQEMLSLNGREDINKMPEGKEMSSHLLYNADFNIEKHAEEPQSNAYLDSDCNAPLSSKKCLQQGHDQMETQCKVQDDLRVEKVQEDINSLQQAARRVPKNVELEVVDKGFHQQSLENFAGEESLCKKTLQVEPDETKPEVNLTLSEQHIGMPTIAYQTNRLVGITKGETTLKFPCTTGPENGRGVDIPCGKGEIPSLLSIYKNPLWRDEVNVDLENDHCSQNQEFLYHSYSDEGSFVDSEKNRIGFSKRSLGEVWDTYEGMGGFISSFPNSPSFTTKQVSENNPVDFDSLINSSGSAKKLQKVGEEVSEVPGFFIEQPDGLEDCLGEHGIGLYGSSYHCTNLFDSNVTNQKLAFVANESNSIADEGEAGEEAHDKLDRNGSRIRRELTMQNIGASINIESFSERKLQSDPLCHQHSKEPVQPLHHKLNLANADCHEETHFTREAVIHSNDPMEAVEEVKQVTFMYSDSKEPQKDSQAVEASLPEVPLDLLSTWILSFFTHASKSGGNFKRKGQRQPLIQDKQEEQAELKRIGEKVQALEAEIDRFKQENRKLQTLLKCVIRKMKQLQQGLRRRKRNGSSRGFMTCIYSVHVKRSSKSKIVRKA